MKKICYLDIAQARRQKGSHLDENGISITNFTELLQIFVWADKIFRFQILDLSVIYSLYSDPDLIQSISVSFLSYHAFILC